MLSKSLFKTPLFAFFILCFLRGELFSQWDKYPTYDEYLAMMSKYETDYPELCKVVEFGTSVEGRKLLVAKISDNVGEDEKEPGFLYLSTIHGNEVTNDDGLSHLDRGAAGLRHGRSAVGQRQGSLVETPGNR